MRSEKCFLLLHSFLFLTFWLTIPQLQGCSGEAFPSTVNPLLASAANQECPLTSKRALLPKSSCTSAFHGRVQMKEDPHAKAEGDGERRKFLL